MKRLTNLKMYVVGVVCVLAIASCEKEESLNTEISNQTEGFMSKTGNSDTKIVENTDEVFPVLHERYGADINEEEASAKFEEAVTEYILQNPLAVNNEKGVSTEWFYRIKTITGSQGDNETDGDVKATVKFRTSKGIRYHSISNLDKSGNDRERGQTDYYLYRTSYPGQAVSWIEIQSATICLKGTDGWFPTTFDVYAYPYQQNVAATGGTAVRSHPNVWLDNNYFWGWDCYATGERGTGRLNF
ncbi:hypothetical protein IWQ47_004213 [Aquimarina sp. EL_43]|uniref:hypothetical protein n=1 Tax=unclassified Aquimarina TaxID=2627091 RepID=UPI0018CB8B84|nr:MULTISPECIES: hypothetical protein [unclassified Aquimarina]MBG6132977.1 hypothetical protein [Aquimarina sp. EL_35]MBG6152288.1 hypothetical protein [Aquimarina sp. EL_32]MBG6171126.1 hypothetical protein [Aquimarina sp. EL_43]